MQSASRLAKLALWQNLRSGKIGALAKLALWQTGALAKLTSTLVNWRSGETGTLAKLQWRSQTFIFGGAKRTPKARGHVGGSGGILPRENFEIWSPSMAISLVSGVRFCIILEIIYCRKDLIFNDFSNMLLATPENVWRKEKTGKILNFKIC
jgi:hypothetical protein